jgi:hypothetical protein
MKKRYSGILIILITFLLTFGFINSMFADDSNLIHGVVPAKVTATRSGKTNSGTFYFSYEFWNVGELGGQEYSKVISTSYFSENESKSVQEGYFTGGPNGDIYIQGSQGQIHLKLHDGVTITNEGGDSFSIDNPQAFKGWVDKETDTAPTIDLSILEGPVEEEDGKTYSFIVEVEVTGTPEPDISFNRDDSGGSLGPNNALIKIEGDQEFTVKATATNKLGSVSAEAVLSTKNIKPKPDLIIVIPGGYPGFDLKDTKIEVKNGVIDCVISYHGFDNVPLKGTYDPDTGILSASITIAPQHDTANLWFGLDGNLTIDLSKEKTAGFMTISGNVWQWTEDDGKWEAGDDRGPSGDYSQRVYYTVEYPDGQPEESANSKPASEPVDSNLRFLETGPSLSSSLNPDINCFIKRPGSKELEKVNQNTIINVGDTLITPPGSGNAILYPKDDRESGIRLQPGTNFTITGPTNFLAYGEFLYKAIHDPKSGFYEQFDSFEAQLARLKVKLKGTIVVFKEDGEYSSVKVLEGVAECTEIKTGKIVEINAGEMISATETGIGIVQTFDVDAENARWEKELRAITEVSARTGTMLIILIIVALLLAAAIVTLVLILHNRKKKQIGSGLQAYSKLSSPHSKSYCRYCGTSVSAGSRFCSKCGNKVNG